MGGHVGGEVAARVAIDTLLAAFTREPTTAGLRDAFAKANLAVWQEGQSNEDLRGMGTTLTAVALVSGPDGRDLLALANVGDSRAYVFSEGQLTQVTADHSLAEERMRQGEMTEEEAAVHPQRHILTRALGVSSDVDADMWELHLRAGDRVVICSDGLSNELGIDELSAVLRDAPDPNEAAHKLVESAMERGGSDNITTVVVDVLVGEEGGVPGSVVTPIGLGAGVPLLIATEAATAAGAAGATGAAGVTGVTAGTETAGDATAAIPRIDTLAPGARLGFARQGADLTSEGQQSAEFFHGSAAAVPVARSTTRVPIPPRPTIVPPPAKESRRARRRRLGIPRRITIRVILFVLLVAAVPTAAYFAIRWYAYDNWFLAIKGNQIIIKQGQPGGVLWFNPKAVDHTGVTTSDILPTGVSQIRSGVQEPTLASAKHYVTNLHNEYLFMQSASTTPPGTGTNGVGPSGSIPNITSPPSTTTSTTTVPGATTTSTTVSPP
jgi:protein phosphatase